MTSGNEVVKLPAELIEQFAKMIVTVPDHESGGNEQILRAIMGATNLKDLDAPWTTKREIPTGRGLVFTGIAKADSEYEGGLTHYLIIDTAVPSTGEARQYTCGADAVVAQLVLAHNNDMFPFAGTIVEVESKKVAGWTSKHIEIDHDETKYVREGNTTKKGK